MNQLNRLTVISTSNKAEPKKKKKVPEACLPAFFLRHRSHIPVRSFVSPQDIRDPIIPHLRSSSDPLLQTTGPTPRALRHRSRLSPWELSQATADFNIIPAANASKLSTRPEDAAREGNPPAGKRKCRASIADMAVKPRRSKSARSSPELSRGLAPTVLRETTSAARKGFLSRRLSRRSPRRNRPPLRRQPAPLDPPPPPGPRCARAAARGSSRRGSRCTICSRVPWGRCRSGRSSGGC